jgi:hypothetical protein
MKVEIIREPGTKQADDIIDDLCTADNAGLQKGRNYLDENGFDKNVYELSITTQTMPLPGATVEILDASLGESFKAKLIGWSIMVDQMDSGKPITIQTDITLERSLNT